VERLPAGRTFDGEPRGRFSVVPKVKILLWLLLLVVCWPVALFALVMYPAIWLVLVPLRIVGIAIEGVLAFVRALFFLPARLLSGSVRH
jgi:hypothetical protein